MIAEISGNSNILVLVGSTNKVKVAAARDAFVKVLPQNITNGALQVIGLDADHGISNWRSAVAVGQPFGLKQTAFGAVNRMQDCWNRAKEYMQPELSHLFVVGFENGLVEGREIGKDPDTWYDICVTAVSEVFSKTGIAIQQGMSVATEFGVNKAITFDEQVASYHKLIMPKVNSKADLYLEWTKNLVGGPFTRADFLRNSLLNSLKKLSVIQQAKQLVVAFAKEGAPASLGPRYKNMHWMRDLAYMTQSYLIVDQKEAVIEALRTLCKGQFQKHELCNNGYEQINRFGNMPIVSVSEKGEKDFLLQRLQGTQEDPYWQIQLWNYCKKYDALSQFPTPIGASATLAPPNLLGCSVLELRDYYAKLLQFTDQLASSIEAGKPKPPGPSFALRCFMEGTLGNLTPGTQDSEIHFIRAIFLLAEKDGADVLLQEFTKPIADAFFYLYMNVVDPQDGLPRGCDSRDIFADMLYDAKTLTNAVFLCDALQTVRKFGAALEKTAFRRHIAEAIENSLLISSRRAPEFLQRLACDKRLSCGEILAEELHKVEKSIKEQLLFKDELFSPRDFIPGARAVLSFSHPVTPSPSNGFVSAYNSDFVKGDSIDPQSLAYAVLQGLIPEKEYDAVVQLFMKEDSAIGVSVFVPISGKTHEEAALLQSVAGRVVWPHVSWAVARALTFMGTVDAMQMAYSQREKLISLGFGEWYAFKDGKTIQGGDPKQGWSASSMLVAEHEFYEKMSIC